MKILGIDPGYALLGYGIIEDEGNNIRPVDFGVIETFPDAAFPERLEKTYNGVVFLCETFQPDYIAFEELFFYHNITTAIPVGAARGVALLAAQQSGKPLYEFTPMQIKLSITGSGSSDKKAVQQMVQMILHLKEKPKPDDAADALACALCLYNISPPYRAQYLIK